MNDKFLLYVEIVLVVLLFLFSVPNAIFQNPLVAALFAVGFILLVGSLYNLGFDTYTPFPEPRKEKKHVQTGVYQYVRHPMYLAIMLIGLALVASSRSFAGAIIYVALIIILDQKATVEEKYLEKLHSTYKAYAHKTKKFIPFVY